MVLRYSNFKIAVIGDYMLDRYVICKPARISQEAPVMILKEEQVKSVLGGAGNVVSNLRELGLTVVTGGVIGGAHFGKELHSLLISSGTDISGLIIDDSRKTTVKTRIVAKGQQLLRYDVENTHEISEEIENKIIDTLINKQVDAIVIVDYAKGVITDRTISKLQYLGKPIFINGKPENILKYKGVTGLICNDCEFRQALLLLQDTGIVRPNFRDLIEAVGCEFIIHTKAEKGLSVYTIQKSELVPGIPVKEIDPTGASDTVIATLVAEYLKTDIFTAAKLANRAASIVVQKFGTHPITWDEIKEYV